MDKHDLRMGLFEIFRELENVVAQDVKTDAGGIVTNHMAATWKAKEAAMRLVDDFANAQCLGAG